MSTRKMVILALVVAFLLAAPMAASATPQTPCFDFQMYGNSGPLPVSHTATYLGLLGPAEKVFGVGNLRIILYGRAEEMAFEENASYAIDFAYDTLVMSCRPGGKQLIIVRSSAFEIRKKQ